MPESQRIPRVRKRPLVALSATITLDGKLDDPAPILSGVHTEGSRFEPDFGSARKHPFSTDPIPTGELLETVRQLRADSKSHRITYAVDASGCRALLEAGLVDELFLVIRPSIDGRRDAPTLSGPPSPEFFPRSVACRLLSVEPRDGECLLHYRVVRRAPTRTRAG